MRLEKYQGYYIKKIGNGACQVLDINQNSIQIAHWYCSKSLNPKVINF